MLPRAGPTNTRDITQYKDIHAAAASNVLTARNHYTVEDPYNRSDTPDSRPTFGLGDGESDGIVLTNALDGDGFLTDEFGGRTSRSSTRFSRGHASFRRRDSSVTTPETDT